MSVLVDSNVLLDIATEDPRWAEWSAARLAEILDAGAVLVINPIIYAELSAGYPDVATLDAILSDIGVAREDLPWAAAIASVAPSSPIDDEAAPGHRFCPISSSGPTPLSRSTGC